MNTKFNKIMSVLAIVAIVASSFVWAVPVAASTPGDSQWVAQDMPATTNYTLLPASGINDISVGSDGKTIYVADTTNVLPSFPKNYILKSTDGGQSFSLIMGSGTSAYAGGVPVALSVAPDDVNTIAVTDGATVWLSKDGGTTWASLPSPLTGVYLGSTITDIAVCPARAGTLLGREYVISLANGGAGVNGGIVAGNFVAPCGDVLIIGNTAAWTSVGVASVTGVPVANQITGVFDFTSVVVTPNFLGDRCVVAVGTTATASSTALVIVNTGTNNVIVGAGAPVTGTKLVAGGNTVDVGGVGGIGITTSSIALPTNFDPTTSSGRRAYVGFASNGAETDNDVYRVDDTGSVKLGAVTAAPVYSVAYSGTTDTGILFMGPQANADVKYTTGMTSSSPTWTTTLKDPTGAAAPNIILRVASDYASSSKVFCGTTGAESAFSISPDAGVTFNGVCLINCGNGVGGAGTTISGGGTSNPFPYFAADGKTMFLYCKDSYNNIALYKTAVPWTATSWMRVIAKASTGTGSVKLNPGWTTTPAIYFFESGVVNGLIYVSQDGGASFTSRNGPSGISYVNAAVRDAQTVYYCDSASTGSIYKSTNAGWTWTTAVPCLAGAIDSTGGIILPAANQVIVAGTLGVSISNDDSATFNTMNLGLPTAGSPNWSVVSDSKYSTNNIIYNADRGNGASANWYVYRIKTDSISNTWEQMTALPAAAGGKIRSITTRSGVLYIGTDQVSVFTSGALVTAGGVLRTVYPTDLVGNQNWSALSQGLPSGFVGSITTIPGINIYAVSGAAPNGVVYGFNDVFAATKPTLTTPADNYADSVNPTSGNGYAVDLKWSPMGSGTSQVDKVDVEIVDKQNGFTGTPTLSAVAVSPTNPIVNTGTSVVLQPNHTYQWRVRAAHTSSGQVFDGVWSDPRTLTIQSGGQVQQQYAGVVILGPTGGATNLDPNLVGFAWAPVAGATEYTVTVATDATLTKTVSGTPAKVTGSAYQVTGLTAGTTYFWAVQATQPTVGLQTISTFTTMAKPVTQPTGTAAIQPVQTIVVNPTGSAETPVYIWAVIAIGAILVIAVIILIVRTRRVP